MHAISTAAAGRADASGRVEPVIDYAIADSAIGTVLVAMSARGICAVLPGDDAADVLGELADRFDGVAIRESRTGLGGTLAAVLRRIDDPHGAGGDTGDEVDGWPLDTGGTPFQKRVW
jgi:AraC family transcriptional regulator of adaptative response/methylated-DNA-[protein]-cysteine methyltransferase